MLFFTLKISVGGGTHFVAFCLAMTIKYPRILVCSPAIEDEYTGPKLDDGKVTLQFMKDMMDWFKEQKKLHRKCAYQVSSYDTDL